MNTDNLFRPRDDESTAGWVDLPHMEEVQKIRMVHLYCKLPNEQKQDKERERDALLNAATKSALQWVVKNKDDKNYFIGEPEFTEEPVSEPVSDGSGLYETRIVVRIYRYTLKRRTLEQLIMEHICALSWVTNSEDNEEVCQVLQRTYEQLPDDTPLPPGYEWVLNIKLPIDPNKDGEPT